MWNGDYNSRHWKKDTGIGDEMFPQTPRYLVHRSHNQWGSESQNWKRHRAVLRPPGFSEKTNWSGTGTSHDHLDWPRLSYREQFKEGDEEADRGNDGKTTSKSGLALNGITYYRKPRTREEWRKLVAKSTVVPQRSARLRDRQKEIL